MGDTARRSLIAGDILRGIRSQPTVTLIAVVAAVVALARQMLLPMPEVFPLGEELGELLYDLGIATLAAWIFNLLVVVMPRLRVERLMLARVNHDLRQLARSATTMLETLERAANSSATVPDPLTRAGIEALCQATSPGTRWPGRPGPRQPRTLAEYLKQQTSSITRQQERLEVAYPFLPIELVALLQQVSRTGLIHAIDRLEGRRLASLNLISPQLYRHALACQRLAGHIRDHVEPMLPR